jgi:hypothetical protein
MMGKMASLDELQVERLRLPRSCIGLYSLSLGLVGWSLSLSSIITYGVVFLVVLSFYLLTRRQLWFDGLLGQAPQVLLMVLIGSICVTSLFILPGLTIWVILPALSTLLVWQELLYRHYPKWLIFSILVIIGGLGLGLGEGIDLYYIAYSSLSWSIHG